MSDSDASVGYYPVQIDDHLPYAEHIKKPAMFHIAEQDGFCPPESQEKIAEAFNKNSNISIHLYPGVDHAFARLGGSNYDRAAASLANQRTAEIFKTALN